MHTTMSTTCHHTTMTTTAIRLRCAPWRGRQAAPHRIQVEFAPDGPTVRVWDDVAEHYTLCHALDARAELRAARKAAEQLAEPARSAWQARLRVGERAWGALCSYLSTPDGGWGETQQAYRRLRDAATNAGGTWRVPFGRLVEAAAALGVRHHPGREVAS